MIVQLDNEKYFPGKTNFFVFRSPMKCKEKINKERKKYTKRFILLRQLGILIFFSLIKQNKTMLESRWQWDILVFYSRSRDNWCGFVDVLFGDKGCEIVGEWGLVVLILVEQKGNSHFNFLYKRSYVELWKRSVRHVSWWILKYTGRSQIPTTSHLRFADWFERTMGFWSGAHCHG